MTEHKHSSSSSGSKSCERCKLLRKRKSTRSRLRVLGGTADLRIAASYSRAVIKDLHDTGLSYKEIARRAGLGWRTVFDILHHGRTHTRVSTLEALKRVRRERPSLPTVWRRGTVSPDRARRVIEGLMFRGWSGLWIAEKLGVRKDYVSQVLRKEFTMISVEREAALVELAHEYGDIESDLRYARKTKNLAAARGYVSVVSWDDLL